jgi:hypothetical protein
MAELLDVHYRWIKILTDNPALIRYVTYASIIILLYTFHGVSSPEFIYFQF